MKMLVGVLCGLMLAVGCGTEQPSEVRGEEAALGSCLSEGYPDAVGADEALADLLECVERDAANEDCPCHDEPTLDGGCFVTGGGHLRDKHDEVGSSDNFGGNAKGMRDGTVKGQWQDTTHQGDLFHGSVTWLRCWKDDGEGPEVPKAIPNNAEWGGPGVWNHEEGFTFRVHATDRREGGKEADTYSIEVWNADGDLVYESTETIEGGNLQIHPPNNGHPYSVENETP